MKANSVSDAIYNVMTLLLEPAIGRLYAICLAVTILLMIAGALGLITARGPFQRMFAKEFLLQTFFWIILLNGGLVVIWKMIINHFGS